MSEDRQENPDVVAAGVRRWAVKNLAFVILLAAVLFGTAGTLRWLGGWLYLALVIGQQLLLAALFLRRDPAWLAERSRPSAGAKAWDVPLAASMAIIGPLAMVVVSALDVRHDWIGYLETRAILTGFVVAVAGSALVTWAMLSNRFFAGVAAIQTGRGHAVATGGPYAIVRHPGYLGSIIVTLATPTLLGSQWAMFVAYLLVPVIMVRTHLEDRMLLAELPGYREYAARVRYRLFPGVW